MNSPVIAVIEWSSDLMTDPSVFIGDSVESVKRAAVRYLIEQSAEFVRPLWGTEIPVPDPDSADMAQVSEWLEALAQSDAGQAIVTTHGATDYHDVRPKDPAVPVTVTTSQVDVIREALGDAIAYRDPDSDEPNDYEAIDRFRDLGRELGIDYENLG